MFKKAIFCSILGAFGGLAAHFIARPFLGDVATQSVHPHFTLGSVFGWLSHGLLGFFVCGSIAAVLGYDEAGPRGLARGIVLGSILGAIAGYGSDAFYDWLLITLGLSRDFGVGIAFDFLWSFLICASLSLAIFLATGPSLDRLKRCAVATAGATIVSTAGRKVIAHLTMFGLVFQAVQSKGSVGQREVWLASGPTFMVQFCAIGIVIGLVYGLVETMMKPVRLRQILGKNEWKSWPITGLAYRIGSAETSEIRIASNAIPATAAQIVKQGDRYAIYRQDGELIVNNLPTQSHWLLEGDVIRIGDSLFVYGEGRFQQPETDLRSPKTTLIDHRLIDRSGNLYSLHQGTTIVGRDSSVDVPVAWDNRASRRHAEIRIQGGEAIVTDLGSRNGTLIDGMTIQSPTRLNSGNRIQIGATEFTYLA